MISWKPLTPEKLQCSLLWICPQPLILWTTLHSFIDVSIPLVYLATYVISWIRSYLTDRSSFVKIDSSSSPSTTILTGVPQGYVLGLLLQNIWNASPNYLSSIPTLPAFRRALKHHLFLLAHPDNSESVRSNQLNVSHFVIQRQLLPYRTDSPEIPCRSAKGVPSECLRLVKVIHFA